MKSRTQGKFLYNPGIIPFSSNGLVEKVPEQGASTISVDDPVSLGELQEVIKFDPADMKLVRERTDGSVRMEVKVDVNLAAATRVGVSTLDLKLLKFGPDSDSISQERPSPDQVINSMLRATSEGRKKQAKSKERLVKKVKIDVTKAVNNQVASKLPKASLEEAVDLIGTQTVFEAVPIASQAQVASQIPILQTPTSKGGELLDRTDRSARQIFLDSLYKDGRTIAASSQPLVPFITAEEALAGISRGSKDKDNRKRRTSNTSKTASDLRINALQGLFTSGPVTDLSNANELLEKRGGSKEAGTVVRARTDSSAWRSVTQSFTIDRDTLDSLANNFNVSIVAVNGDGEEVQTAGCCVDLVDKVVESQFDPVTTDESMSGQSFSGASYNDATGRVNGNVSILEPGDEDDVDDVPGYVPGWGGGNLDHSILTLDPFEPMDKEWESMGNSTESSESFGLAGSGRTIVIRTSPVGFSPPAPSFSEVLIPAVTRHLATASPLLGKAVAEVDNRFCSVTTFLRKGGITVRVAGLQSACSICVVRRDLTLREKQFNPINVNEPILLVDENTKESNFVDRDVKHDHVYEYKVRMYTRAGRTMMGTGSSVIEYKELVDNLATITASTPKVTIDAEGTIDVKFDLQTTLTDSNVSAFVEILKSQGLDNLFTDDIVENRDKLKKVIVYHIERVDLTRGNVESFGLFKGGRFSDKAQRGTQNVSSLLANRTYRYVVTLLVREPESLIPSIVREKVDKVTGQRYSLQPSKHFHPTTLRTGTLKTSKDIDAGSYVEEFLAGFSGAQVAVTVSTMTTGPKILGGSCTKDSLGRAEVRWKISGRASQIDHFVVTAELSGMKSIVGRVQAISHNNSFRFVDKTLAGTAGDVLYFVTPVFSNLTVGEPVKIGRIEDRKSRVKKA